jgi:Sortase domain
MTWRRLLSKASWRVLLVALIALISLAEIVAVAILWNDNGASHSSARVDVPTSPTPWQRQTTLPQPITGMRVAIPKLGIDTNVVRLGLNADRSLQVPTNPRLAGWWSGGTYPGRAGPAVIVGHLDSTTGPAAFSRLGDLRPGDTIEIGHRGSSVDTFTVTRTAIYPKKSFPTKLVYGEVPRPSLRLITCAGTYDRRTGYEDNLIVFADSDRLPPTPSGANPAVRTWRSD